MIENFNQHDRTQILNVAIPIYAQLIHAHIVANYKAPIDELTHQTYSETAIKAAIQLLDDIYSIKEPYLPY